MSEFKNLKSGTLLKSKIPVTSYYNVEVEIAEINHNKGLIIFDVPKNNIICLITNIITSNNSDDKNLNTVEFKFLFKNRINHAFLFEKDLDKLFEILN